jgi:hypothetical protein
MSQFFLFRYSILWILYFVLSVSQVMALEDKPDNAREIVLSLVKALRAIEHPKSGRGTAVVQEVVRFDTMDGPVTKIVNEELVAFVFKGQMTLSKKFEFKDNEKGSLKTTFAIGNEIQAYYDGYSASIISEPKYHWYRAFAQDFHPATFLFVQDGGTVTDILENAAKKGKGPIVLDEKDNALITIKIGNSFQCVLDKNKGDRLIEYIQNLKGGPVLSHFKHIQLQWKRYGLSWYIDNAEIRDRSTHKFGVFKDKTTSIYIQDFKPDVEVCDTEFDLASLDVPMNTRIINKVTGQTYRYER